MYKGGKSADIHHQQLTQKGKVYQTLQGQRITPVKLVKDSEDNDLALPKLNT